MRFVSAETPASLSVVSQLCQHCHTAAASVSTSLALQRDGWKHCAFGDRPPKLLFHMVEGVLVKSGSTRSESCTAVSKYSVRASLPGPPKPPSTRRCPTPSQTPGPGIII